MTHWEGVQLAPNRWPGRDKVLVLAATLKLVCGVEYKYYKARRRGDGPKYTLYTSMDEADQRVLYPVFKSFYDKHMMRKFL